MKVGTRAGFGLALMLLTVGPVPVRAQPDTIAPPRAADLHAQRRAWLEARRSGALPATAPEYGSAVVGAPDADVAGGFPVGGHGPAGGPGVPVICHGYLAGTPIGPVQHQAGAIFQGRCVPAGHSPWSGGPVTGPVGPIPRESYWNGWGWTPAYPFGWSAGGGGAYQFAWPGGYADECALLRIVPAGAPPIELPVGLRSLGTAEAQDLDLAVEARLARGLPVDLYGLDGRYVRLPAGTLLDDIRVRPCPTR